MSACTEDCPEDNCMLSEVPDQPLPDDEAGNTWPSQDDPVAAGTPLPDDFSIPTADGDQETSS